MVAVKAVGESDLGDVVMVSIARPEASTPAAAAAMAAGVAPGPAEQASWSRMLILGNLIGIPLLAIAFFAWRRMTQ